MSKLHRLQNILFLVVLGLLPFNFRHIFNFDSIKNIEGFREHISFSLFPFDIPLLILILLVGFELWQKHSQSMEVNSATYKLRPHKISQKHVFRIVRNPITYFIIALSVSALISEHKGIALYSSARITQAVLFSSIALFLLDKNTKTVNRAILVVFVSGFFQSIIAIFQFSLQHSLGLKYLGESVIAPEILGVAKFEFAGEKFIRAYGTLPHPNVLGFILLLSLACGIWLLKNNFHKRNCYLRIFLPLGLFSVFSGIILSYSRSIITSTIIFLAVIIFFHKKSILDFYRSLCKKIKINRIFHAPVALVLFFMTLFVLYNLLTPRLCVTHCPGESSTSLRSSYNHLAQKVISKNSLLGIGSGNFVPYLKDHHSQELKSWEFQPVHNVYLLVTSEIGLLGLFSFLILIILAFVRSSLYFKNLKKNPFAILFVLVFLIALVDHYFWTLPQGQLAFWLSLAFFEVSARIERENDLLTDLSKNQ